MARIFRSDDTSRWPYRFGNGTDGSLTISSNTVDTAIVASCAGTSGTTSLAATNASFAAGQLLFIHQTRGTGAGLYELNRIASYVAGTITLSLPLQNTYSSTSANAAQVVVMKQYTNITINAGTVWYAQRWSTTNKIGGILPVFYTGTLTNNGTINIERSDTEASIQYQPAGFRRADQSGPETPSYSGEGTSGAATKTTSAYGNAGSGVSGAYGAPGGGNGTAGSKGPSNQGTAGSASGSAENVTMTFGGAGGHGGRWTDERYGSNGGDGGGIFVAFGRTFTNNGSILGRGQKGDNVFSYTTNEDGAGGGGAGGSVLLKAVNATLGTITLTGGVGGTGKTSQQTGGAGGVGRSHLDYSGSYTAGTTNPTTTVRQDSSLMGGGASFLFNFV